jgi:hypothetical protein
MRNSKVRAKMLQNKAIQFNLLLREREFNLLGSFELRACLEMQEFQRNYIEILQNSVKFHRKTPEQRNFFTFLSGLYHAKYK